MAIVTGSLSHFGLASMMPFSPELWFIPSSAAVTGTSFVIASKPIKAELDVSTGAFSVDLLPNVATRPATYYSMRITWLNGAGIPTGADFPDWQLIVPPEGGAIATLMATPWNPALVWVGETPPDGTPTVNTFWLNPVSGDFWRWS